MLDRCRIQFALLLCVSSCAPTLTAADIAAATGLYQSGQFEQCITTAAKAIEDGEYSESWRILKIRSELAVGKYPEAQQTLRTALKRYRRSVRLRWLADTVYRFNGDDASSRESLAQIDELTDGSMGRYRDLRSRIALGRYFLSQGVDPKEVLDAVYNEVKRRARDYPETYIAAGELALEKHDYQLAAEEFEAANRIVTNNPEIHYGLARAYADSNAPKAEEHLKLALAQNPNHVDSLLFLAENHLNAERYEEVERLLDEVTSINVREPRVWAYRAVLAHLENDLVGAEAHRNLALAWWKTNPQVDSLIGSKLSQKYRFAEGAVYQRQALSLDSNYLPAQLALSQDLLRLGQEEEGWQLASAVNNADGYNVVAHNLVTLHDEIAGYHTIETGDFLIRMDPSEAAVYGQQVTELLQRAKAHLCRKYEVEIDAPVLVEIFPRQQDFAIRTFGLPGGAGFLGVCFGGVITANSPASQVANPVSWESVLWHEFCHVVTLTKTHNKMPRWLSEGISVYEEVQESPAWGESMTPQYREMILRGELTPVTKLSAAFLRPETPVHLQFAYFESAMVVEFLIEKHGLETIQRILVDLGVGMPINESLQRYTGSLASLDKDFAEYAKERAESLAPQLDWTQPDLPETAKLADWKRWNEEHPDNYWGLRQLAAQHLGNEQWEAAKQPLKRLLELYPEDAGTGSAYVRLASVYRKLGETEQEWSVLKEFASRSADAVASYLRLMELGEERQDWETVQSCALRMLAVNPLQPAPHRFLTRAAEERGDDQLAVRGLRVLALMDPRDPADVHFRLATLLRRQGELADARLHILQSLEDAPRFRQAHRELLEIQNAIEQGSTGEDPSVEPEIDEGDS